MPKPHVGNVGPRRTCFLRFLILHVLMENGRLTTVELARLSDNSISQRSAYTTLYRLEKDGFIKSSHEEVNEKGRPDKVRKYWITEKGVDDHYFMHEFIKRFFKLKEVL